MADERFRSWVPRRPWPRRLLMVPLLVAALPPWLLWCAAIDACDGMAEGLEGWLYELREVCR